jgi:peptidoglycan biosynthesis protein MviN/MurJ (putative lipid II flippase)
MVSHAFGFLKSLDAHSYSAVLLGLLPSAISSAKYESSLLPFYNEYDQSSIQHFLLSETRVLFEANLVVCAARTSFLPIVIILYSELRCSTSFLPMASLLIHAVR